MNLKEGNEFELVLIAAESGSRLETAYWYILNQLAPVLSGALGYKGSVQYT
jgi:hypothetical protein